MEIGFIDWGLKDYAAALQEQETIFNDKVRRKLLSEGDISQDFIVCEHPNVYTLGKHGKESNLLAKEEFLKKINASFYHINRGGDITYHGPGQIVGYPSLDIDALGLTLRTYIETIEESVIRLMAEYSIKCERLKGATGVWLDAHSPKARKVGVPLPMEMKKSEEHLNGQKIHGTIRLATGVSCNPQDLSLCNPEQSTT